MDELLVFTEGILWQILIALLFVPAPVISTASAFLVAKRTRWYIGLIVFVPLCYGLLYLNFSLVGKFSHLFR